VPPLGWRIRAGALIAIGALGVHDLRYLIAYRGHAGRELAVQGHGYLALATPLIAGLVVLAAAAFASRLAGAYARGEGDAGASPSVRRLWAFASALLVLVFSIQEWIEGQLATGHPAGVGAVFGHGGWIAVPLAMAIGLVIALLLRGAEQAIAIAAARHSPLPALQSLRLLRTVGGSVWAPVSSGALAGRHAPRAPPLPA
jgi:hypothetical protein